MYEGMNVVFSVGLSLFMGYCLSYFYGSFLEYRIKIRGIGLFIGLFYGVLRILRTYLLAWDFSYKTAVGKLALSLGILFVLALCFYKAFRAVTIFLVVAFQAIADISRYAVVILMDKVGAGILDLWNFCMGKGIITSDKVFDAAVKGGVVFVLFLEYFFIALLTLFSLKKIVRDYREKDYAMNRTELLFILTPAAVGLMICMLLRIIIITVEKGIPEMLYDRYPVLIFVIPAILLLSLLSILYGVKLFQDMICHNREKSGRMVLEKQVKAMQEHMEEMERIYSGIRGMKHDMNNTLSVIQRLSAGKGENEELQAYLGDLNRNLELLSIRFKTGNTVVDTLLDMKYHEAVREVPDLKMDADKLLFPGDLKIHSYDIGVILGNALDNAIEACKKQREKEPEEMVFIRLESLLRGNFLIIRVENSFDGNLIVGQEFPATSKRDKKSHGIGLSNIKSTAEKYQGTMDYRVVGKVFLLSVMMKN